MGVPSRIPAEKLPVPPLWIELAQLAGGGFQDFPEPVPFLVCGLPLQTNEADEVRRLLETAPGKNHEIERRLAMALLQEKAGRIQEACDLLRAAPAGDLSAHATRLRICLAAGRSNEAVDAATKTVAALDQEPGSPCFALRQAALPFGFDRTTQARHRWIEALKAEAHSPSSQFQIGLEELDLAFHEGGAEAVHALVAHSPIWIEVMAGKYLDGQSAAEGVLRGPEARKLTLQWLRMLWTKMDKPSEAMDAVILDGVRNASPGAEEYQALLLTASLRARNLGSLLDAMRARDAVALEACGDLLLNQVSRKSLTLDASAFASRPDLPCLRLFGLLRTEPAKQDEAYTRGLEEVVPALIGRLAGLSPDDDRPVRNATRMESACKAVEALSRRVPIDRVQTILLGAESFKGLHPVFRLRLLARARLPAAYLDALEALDWTEPRTDTIPLFMPRNLADASYPASPPALAEPDLERILKLFPSWIAGGPHRERDEVARRLHLGRSWCAEHFDGRIEQEEFETRTWDLLRLRGEDFVQRVRAKLRELQEQEQMPPPTAPPSVIRFDKRPGIASLKEAGLVLAPFLPPDIERLDGLYCGYGEWDDLGSCSGVLDVPGMPERLYRRRTSLAFANSLNLYLLGNFQDLRRWRAELSDRLPADHPARAQIALADLLERSWPDFFRKEHAAELPAGPDDSEAAFRQALRTFPDPPRPWEEAAAWCFRTATSPMTTEADRRAALHPAEVRR